MSNHFKIIHPLQGGDSLQLVLCLNNLEENKSDNTDGSPKFCELAPEIQTVLHVGFKPSPLLKEPRYVVRKKYMPEEKNERPLGGPSLRDNRDQFNVKNQPPDLRPKAIQFWPLQYMVGNELSLMKERLVGDLGDEIHLAIRVMHVSRFQMCRHFRILVREVDSNGTVTSQWYTPPIKVIAKATPKKGEANGVEDAASPSRARRKKDMSTPSSFQMTRRLGESPECEVSGNSFGSDVMHNSTKMIQVIEEALQSGKISDSFALKWLNLEAEAYSNATKRVSSRVGHFEKQGHAGGKTSAEDVAMLAMVEMAARGSGAEPHVGEVVWVRSEPLACYWPAVYLGDVEHLQTEAHVIHFPMNLNGEEKVKRSDIVHPFEEHVQRFSSMIPSIENGGGINVSPDFHRAVDEARKWELDRCGGVSGCVSRISGCKYVPPAATNRSDQIVFTKDRVTDRMQRGNAVRAEEQEGVSSHMQIKTEPPPCLEGRSHDGAMECSFCLEPIKDNDEALQCTV